MPGLLRGVARTAAIAGTATAVSNNVSRRQARRWDGQEQSQQTSAPEPSQPPVDEVAQIEKLGQLKEQGLITQQEFDAKKQQILGL
ncbi:MAG TPA: SHOCT domain-containing protein [Candidatus Saccharimonadales bacterium]|nr:SHOCT domain-containing protein [Candidatus Saccharimonadales bacterium]